MLGQDHILNRLRDAEKRGALHHAYLFAGPSGMGKAEAARWLAQLANCEGAPAAAASLFGDAPAADAPCGQCTQCRLIAEGSHPDVLWVGPSEKSKKGLILIEQARLVRSEVSRRPVAGRRKVVILSPADEMELPAVSCLLKTLEEPPECATLVLLVGDAANVIPTILSRCQVMRFAPVSAPEISSWLRSQGADERAAASLARLSGGRPGEAIRLWKDVAAMPRRERTMQWLEDVSRAALPDTLCLAERLRAAPDGQPADVPDALNWAATWFRDVMVIQSGSNAALVNADREAGIRQAAERYGSQQAQNALAAILRARRYLAGNANAALVAENLVMDLIPSEAAG